MRPSMSDYTELVKALRCENTGDDECGSSDCPYWSGLGCMDGQLMEDAADAIEELQAEIRESMQKCAECGDRMVEPKQGEWVRKEDKLTYWYVCSECGYRPHSENYPYLSDYCPNCGAKMEVQDA